MKAIIAINNKHYIGLKNQLPWKCDEDLEHFKRLTMGQIPHYLIKDGLPNMMGGIIQKGVLDPQVLFLSIGDHECDRYPLQVGQFESGDEELDMWLTRTYIEGGGGANEGETYLLAWYFGSQHTVCDNWEKRKQKGFIFTIGDEPSLSILPSHVIQNLMNTTTQKTSYGAAELLEMAKKQYHVYHLHIMEGNAGHRSYGYWKQLLGDNCIKVNHHQEVSSIISDIVTKNVEINNNLLVDSVSTISDNTTETEKKSSWDFENEIIL